MSRSRLEHQQIAKECGEPALTIANFVRRGPSGGVTALFQGRQVHWAYNTRVAIHAGCQILGLQPGDEVLAPAYNCGSELDPLVALGLNVTLYPIENNLVADPDRIEMLITNKTRAIYVTHYFGVLQSRMDDLRALCDQHGIRLIEDCALSLLSGESPVEGRHGDISVFCFHKFVPTPQGGALVINAPDIRAEKPLLNTSLSKSDLKAALRLLAQVSLGAPRFNLIMQHCRSLKIGTLTDATLAEGLTDIPRGYYFDSNFANRRMGWLSGKPLASFDVLKIKDERRRNWLHMAVRLAKMSNVNLVMSTLDGHTCPLNMPIIVSNRGAVARKLQQTGIAATPWWGGYNQNLNWSGQEGAKLLKESVLALPIHQALNLSHIDHICDVLEVSLRE